MFIETIVEAEIDEFIIPHGRNKFEIKDEAIVHHFESFLIPKGMVKIEDVNEMDEVEESLQSTRKLYNKNVSNFNHKIVAFPSNIIAKMKKYKRKDFFEADILLTKEEVDSL